LVKFKENYHCTREYSSEYKTPKNLLHTAKSIIPGRPLLQVRPEVADVHRGVPEPALVLVLDDAVVGETDILARMRCTTQQRARAHTQFSRDVW
jgi:hypothetical protein